MNYPGYQITQTFVSRCQTYSFRFEIIQTSEITFYIINVFEVASNPWGGFWISLTLTNYYLTLWWGASWYTTMAEATNVQWSLARSVKWQFWLCLELKVHRLKVSGDYQLEKTLKFCFGRGNLQEVGWYSVSSWSELGHVLFGAKCAQRGATDLSWCAIGEVQSDTLYTLPGCRYAQNTKHEVYGENGGDRYVQVAAVIVRRCLCATTIKQTGKMYMLYGRPHSRFPLFTETFLRSLTRYHIVAIIWWHVPQLTKQYTIVEVAVDRPITWSLSHAVSKARSNIEGNTAQSESRRHAERRHGSAFAVHVLSTFIKFWHTYHCSISLHWAERRCYLLNGEEHCNWDQVVGWDNGATQVLEHLRPGPASMGFFSNRFKLRFLHSTRDESSAD